MSAGRELSNVDIVLYSLHKLGGVSRKIHTELIAWEAYNFSEERFCWSLPEFRKRKFPDKTAVRYALETAKKQKLVEGRAGKDKGGGESEGWQFAPEGIKWFSDNQARIAKGLKIQKPISLELPKHQAQRFIKGVHKEKIYHIYKEKKSLEDASTYDFTDMLRCSPDASIEVIKKKFDHFKTMAFAINDVEIRSFLNMCEEKFKELLTN